jgi:2',3'-cyclic-nucleotide 2'-phosphodiesterase (5'-nucleotidase family)
MHRPRLAVLVTGTLVAGTLVVGAVSTSTQAADAPAAPEPPLPAVRFQELGSYSTGAADLAEEVTAAEIVAYDDDTMYVMTVGGIDVVDISDPTNPSKQGQIVLPGDPTSVAVDDGLVAVSVPADPKTSPGTVFFFQGSNPAGQVTVGALPDMVTFTPDGRTLVVANEGEPSSYGQPDSIDPEGSISLIETKDFRKRQALTRPPRERARTISFTDFNVGNRRNRELPAGVRITGPNATVAQDLEPEYITIAGDGRTAWVSLQENNALAVLDLRSRRVDRIVALGTSDHSVAGFGFDASDRDGRIDISTRSTKGLYMPDGLANFELRGKQYVLTANEGDARDYTGFVDVGRARSVADTATIPAAGVDAQLGRLNVITTAPATKNAAGKVTDLYTLGSRSFSIRTAKGELVWDSGDAFEQITARTLPGNFNASNSSNDFDGRSDDKGPEPENVVVGKIDRRQYAFVALERIGGIMVYDVTDPTAPVFQQYLTTRIFPASAGGVVGPDSGPEGLVFVEARKSPTGQPLVLLGNEVTGTVNIFGLAPTDGAGTLTLLHNNDGESTIEPLPNGTLSVAGVAAYKSVLDREIRDARNAGNAVMNVYAGDAVLASSTLACSLPPFPPTTPIYDAIAQRQMAYDAHVLGNHEFDFTPDFLERFVRSFERNGTPVQPFLSSNLDFTGEPTWADLLDADGVIQVQAAGGKVVARSADLVDEVTGMRVGIVGVTTPLLPTISSPRNVTLLSTDLASTAAVAQQQIDLLTLRGVNKIVLVSHLQDVNNDKELVALLRSVDVAVAGGGDELLANADTPLLPTPPTISGTYPIYVAGADGAQVPIVTTEGNYKYAGRIDLEFDAAGNLTGIDEAKSFPRRVVVADAASAAFPDAVAPNTGVQQTAVAPVTACLANLTQPIARTEVALNVSQGAPGLGFTNGVRTGETNGGNLVTDGFLRSYDVYAGAAGLPPRATTKVVAVQNGGGIRQNAGSILPRGATLDAPTSTYVGVPGPISRKDTLDVMAFLSNAVTVVRDVTPDELKLMFERSAGSLPGSGGQFLQVAGLTVTYQTSGTAHAVSAPPPGGTFGTVTTPGSRVVSVTLDDGTPIIAGGAVVAGAPNVSIVTNSFTAAGGDNYAALGSIPADRKVNLGLTYEQALADYVLSFPVAEGLPTIPASDARYANPNGSGRITITP